LNLEVAPLEELLCKVLRSELPYVFGTIYCQLLVRAYFVVLYM
jgi:hypothetical protein